MRWQSGLWLLVVLAVNSCALNVNAPQSSPVAQAPGAAVSTPETERTPRADRTRPANFTPPANFPPSAQGTRDAPRSQATPQSAAVTAGAPTAVVVSAITQTNTIPTAVPIPSIVIPTALASSSNTSTTGGTAPNNTQTDKGGNPLPPLAPTPLVVVGASNTSTTTPPALPTIPASTATVEELHGKIVFFSDRGGAFPQLYVMNADGSEQRLCNCSELLPIIVASNVSTPDKREFLFVRQVGGGRLSQADFQIWSHNTQTNEDKSVTGGAPGFPTVDYDPAWSPNLRFIAWVSETNGFDEIYLHDRSSNEDTRLTTSHSEWYKHPTFSPDGSQIAYWTNRDTARKQVWVMNQDGTAQHNVSNNSVNDWDPFWVK